MLYFLFHWVTEPLPAFANPETPPRWPTSLFLLANCYVYGGALVW